MKRIKSIAISLLITLLLLELVSILLLRRGFIPHDLPTYSLQNARSNFWVEDNTAFGVWHAPHSRFRQLRSCFDAVYQANSQGMRDPERSLSSEKPRVVVLGDSLTEGYGLQDGKRMTDLLEKGSGKEYLNFGTSGYFGPTQYYLLYKTFAKNFSHDEVLIALYPKNDFTDDDIEIWKSSGRYRPFWVGTYPNYQLVYTTEKPKGEPKGFLPLAKGFLREFTHLYNLFDYLEDAIRFKLKRVRLRSHGLSYAGFYDFTEDQWDRMRFNLEKILEEAKGKKVTIALIPALTDLQRYEEKGPAPLSEKMKEFAGKNSIQLIDLLPSMHDRIPQWDKYFFTCEGHWNEFGDQVAAEYISKASR